jgi:DNA-binding XRE family transcriptional regulator
MDLDRLRARFATTEAKNWGLLVRQRRRRLGISQGQLAGLVGCPVQTISKVERGNIVPRDYLKAAISVALADEVTHLFPWPSRRELVVTA